MDVGARIIQTCRLLIQLRYKNNYPEKTQTAAAAAAANWQVPLIQRTAVQKPTETAAIRSIMPQAYLQLSPQVAAFPGLLINRIQVVVVLALLYFVDILDNPRPLLVLLLHLRTRIAALNHLILRTVTTTTRGVGCDDVVLLSQLHVVLYGRFYGLAICC